MNPEKRQTQLDGCATASRSFYGKAAVRSSSDKCKGFSVAEPMCERVPDQKGNLLRSVPNRCECDRAEATRHWLPYSQPFWHDWQQTCSLASGWGICSLPPRRQPFHNMTVVLRYYFQFDCDSFVRHSSLVVRRSTWEKVRGGCI